MRQRAREETSYEVTGGCLECARVGTKAWSPRSVLSGVFGLMICLLLLSSCAAVRYLFSRTSLKVAPAWERVAAVPFPLSVGKPQGLAALANQLVLATYLFDGSAWLSMLDGTGRVLGSRRMPVDATHPSGLEANNGSLWAVDHDARAVYEFDLRALSDSTIPLLLGKWAISLSGPSGMSFVECGGRRFLVISEFSGDRKTYFYDASTILRDSTLKTRLSPITFYKNDGFSQGLARYGDVLLEAINSFGRDHIVAYKISSDDLGRPTVSRLGSFLAPGNQVEDLAIMGNNLWVTDEGDGGLYRLAGVDSIIAGLQSARRP